MEPGEAVPGEHDHNPPLFQLTQQPHPDFSPWVERYGSHGLHSHLHSREQLQLHMAIYYGMISFMDAQIGRILQRLDELGIADRTIVVFTSDHGHFLGQHGLIAKGPFHYEDLVRVPFIVRYPSVVPGNVISTALQSLIDLAPTFLSLANRTIPLWMQGVDQSSAWSNANQGVSARQWVIVENHHQPTKLHLRTYIDARYKLTIHRGAPYGELFDLQEDPREIHNRWDDPSAGSLKATLLQRFLQAELDREWAPMPRIAGA
jgi:uncharacterized sulfatase